MKISAEEINAVLQEVEATLDQSIAELYSASDTDTVMQAIYSGGDRHNSSQQLLEDLLLQASE